MKLISWNVNGIRACINKGFNEFLENENPDIICLQEVKAMSEQATELKTPNHPHVYWNSAERKGYSGVAVFSKHEPISVSRGIGVLDEEGRVLTLEFEDYYLVTVYTPNSKQDLTRVDFRHQEWDKQFLNHVNNLNKPVIFCGDLNVAHQDIDLKNAQANRTTATKPGNCGFTDKEREGFDNILAANYIDTFRHLYPEEIKYSWWSYMFKARQRNAGWRIDYFCTHDSLKDRIKNADILTEVMGSDHCPVVLELH